jgi:hypothetical protein
MGKVIPLKGRQSKPIVPVKSDVESALGRDQWDRPLILPPGGGKPVAYRRASTVAEVLEDHFGLQKWELRLTAEGLAQRPDLVQSIHGASKREVGKIVEEAMEAAGASVASRNGSTMHRLTETLDNTGDVPTGLPSNITAMLEAYEKETARFKVLDTEKFVVCDKIKVGGTYDRRLYDEHTGLTVIGDLKTGQSLSHLALKAPAQVCVYAAGVWYDLDGEREPHGADRNRGLMIWLPWTDNPSEAICEVRWLDLRIGRQLVKEAFRVEQFRKLNHNQTMPLCR